MIDLVIEKLFGLIEPIANLSKERRELRDNALHTIVQALNETSLYYSSLDRGSPRNLDKEAKLARYWSDAAIPIRHIDEELALICEHKSEYWLNPENWGNESIHEVGLALDDVRKRYQQLLAK